MSRSRAWGFTPAAERTVELCRRLSRDAGVSEDWSAVLLFSLLRDESLASACLRDCGIGAGDLGAVLPAGVWRRTHSTRSTRSIRREANPFFAW